MTDWLAYLQSVPAFLGFIFGFGFLIFVHELGHFIAAKWVGIKVEQFAIGFGHALVSYRRGIGLRFGSSAGQYAKQIEDGADGATLGETEYRLNWMPLGGYVKMLGQDDLSPSATSANERAYNNKPIWARTVVISAGVVMNLITGIILFVICFLQGVDFPPAIVGGVNPGGPAATTYAQNHTNDPHYLGLKADDRITHIDGDPVSEFMEIAMATALAQRGQSLTFTVERPGELRPLTYVMTPTESQATKLLSLGIATPITTTIQTLWQTGPLAHLYQSGVRPGMQITTVDDQPIETYAQFERALNAKHGLPASVNFIEPTTGQTVQVDMVSKAQLLATSSGGVQILGLVPAVRISEVAPDSPAARVGVHAGDLIVQLGTVRWPTIEAIRQIVKETAAKPLAISVWREGKEIALESAAPVRKKLFGNSMLGIFMDIDDLVVGQTIAGSPADAIEIVSGSRITSVNGTTVTSWDDLQRIVQTTIADQPQTAVITLGFDLAITSRPSLEKEATLSRDVIQQIAGAHWSPNYPKNAFAMMRHTVKADTVMGAAMLGVDKTQQFVIQTYITLARLFQGTVKVQHLQGPVGIVHKGTLVAQQGWPLLSFFLGVISVNLVVINFLPIPITDGGQMVFLIIEKLKGSPVGPKVQTAAFLVGLAMIGSIFLATLYYNTLDLPFLR